MQAEYPGALWIPAHSSNFRVRQQRNIRLVLIHATDGRGDPKATARMWQEPKHGSSAHFVIGADGVVVQAVPILYDAFHAHSQNAASVGIEHCCRTPGELGKDDPGLPPTLVQLESGASLVAWLCSRLKLQPTRETIQGHAEADVHTSHTGCPTSAGIDLDAYVSRVVNAWCF